MIYPHPKPLDLAVKALELAYNPSQAMGLGHLHYQPGGIPADQLKAIREYGEKKNNVGADYLNGRMVMLFMHIQSDGVYISDLDPSPYYQSWASRYPTNKALLDAASKALES